MRSMDVQIATYTPPKLLGGSLGLDFVNTVDPRFGPRRHEFLSDYADLIAWSRHVDVVDDAQASTLRRVLLAHCDEADDVHARAIDLRESLCDVFRLTMSGQDLEVTDLDVLNSWLERALSKRRLRAGGAHVAWCWDDLTEDHLDRPLWPVVLSAAELLTSSERLRIRACPGDDGLCGWLFLDTSKAGTRHWCSMRGCGNRAKARRHQARVKGGLDRRG